MPIKWWFLPQPYKFTHTLFFKLKLPLHSTEQVKNSVPVRTWWKLNTAGLVGTEMTNEHTLTRKRFSLLTLCYSSPASHRRPKMTTRCGLSCYFSWEARNPEYLGKSPGLYMLAIKFFFFFPYQVPCKLNRVYIQGSSLNLCSRSLRLGSL